MRKEKKQKDYNGGFMSQRRQILSKNSAFPVQEAYKSLRTNIRFFLRDENEANESEAGTRYEIRRKYWAYALDFIRKTNGDGAFSNVNPSKESWISGFFGVQGFSINCVALWDSARVELYLGKSQAQENKKAFDLLHTKRTEIEMQLGTTLIWNRGDEIKSSKIACELKNVSIEHEADWLQMAHFHAEWSKKFYDVIVPYLTRGNE